MTRGEALPTRFTSRARRSKVPPMHRAGSPMRWILAAAIALLVTSAPARADFGPRGLVGNDTGGIIPWSPENERERFVIAGAFCAGYHKYAHISSVHRQYGDYIGFHCYFPPPVPVTRRTGVRSLY